MEKDIIPQSLYFQWHITERCNNRCKHCYQESYATPEFNLGQIDIAIDQLLDLIKSWNLSANKALVYITGGEPLMRSDFFQILAKLFRQRDKFRCGLMSNGLLLNKEMVKKIMLLGVNLFQVSLEGMRENNDLIRGPGSFNKIVRAVKLLAYCGMPTIRVSLSLTKKNSKDVEKLADFLAPLAGKNVQIIIGARRIVPSGNALEMKDLLLDPIELRNFYREVEAINKKIIKKGYNLKVIGGCENGIFNNLISHPRLMKLDKCGVQDGRGITLMPNGDVYPCRRLPIKMGNILEKSLEEIYYSDKMKELRDRDLDHPFCQACDNYQNCFGGAPCVTYAHTGKLNIPDIQCWRAYKNLNESLNKFSDN